MSGVLRGAADPARPGGPARLIVGNTNNEHLVSDLEAFPPGRRAVAGNLSARLLWMLRPGDVLVLPQAQDERFVRYVLGELGVDRDSVTLLVPPPGVVGHDLLTGDRLSGEAFRRTVREAVAASGAELLIPYVFDPSIAALADHLGMEKAPEGAAFLEAGGADLLNSKAVFRAVAAGIGVPLAEGVATRERARAREFAGRLLARGDAVILKQDFHIGGFGNEILAPGPCVRQIGASALTVLADDASVGRYFEDDWDRWTNGGRHPAVLEHYLPDSVAVGAEIAVTSGDVRVLNAGEMRMAPAFDGIVAPGTPGTEAARATFNEAALALSRAVRAIGYRGLINIDGVVAPDGRTLLTEFNGRLGGSTHLHCLAEHLLGPDYAAHRVLITRNTWRVPSLDEALRRTRSAGIAFDHADGTGVLLICDHTRQFGTVEYCVAARDLETALGIEKTLAALFADRS